MANEHAVFSVDGMSCEHCAKTIHEALSVMNGVLNVIVDLEAKRVAVEYDGERMHRDILIGTIEDAGYRVR